MNKPQKNAELIHAWADGAKIEYRRGDNWILVECPMWDDRLEYRIRTEPKAWYDNIPDHGVLCRVYAEGKWRIMVVHKFYAGEPMPALCGDTRYQSAEPLTNDEIKVFLRGDTPATTPKSEEDFYYYHVYSKTRCVAHYWTAKMLEGLPEIVNAIRYFGFPVYVNRNEFPSQDLIEFLNTKEIYVVKFFDKEAYEKQLT